MHIWYTKDTHIPVQIPNMEILRHACIARRVFTTPYKNPGYLLSGSMHPTPRRPHIQVPQLSVGLVLQNPCRSHSHILVPLQLPARKPQGFQMPQ